MRPPPGLIPLLEEARDLGFLGPGPVERQFEHSMGFVEILDGLEPSVVNGPLIDLGSGGGIPGLVIAGVRERLPTVLLEGSVRRAAWLLSAVERLGLRRSVTVIAERAEVAGRAPAWRHGFGVVVARLFGRPAVTAECAAPFLDDGGILIVSEPGWKNGEGVVEDGPERVANVSTVVGLGSDGVPRSENRWPVEGLEELGLGAPRFLTARGLAFVTIGQVSPSSDRYPRRVGIPAKRPLF